MEAVMRSRVRMMIAALVVAAGVSAVVTLSVTRAAGQAARSARTADGKPDFSGIWQAANEANWDLQAHEARAGMVTQQGVYPYEYARVPAAPVLALGAAGGVPGSLGVVEGDGQIPYTPEAAVIKQENAENWIDRDPELKCYLPGVPRAMYMPYPFSNIPEYEQDPDGVRVLGCGAGHPPGRGGTPLSYSYMGHSVGRWDGDALVVDVTDFNGKNWFDRAGNFHSDAAHIEERFTLMTPDMIWYEVAIEDPKTFTRPWKIAMPLYRRMEPNMQLIDYRCTDFVEEFL